AVRQGPAGRPVRYPSDYPRRRLHLAEGPRGPHQHRPGVLREAGADPIRLSQPAGTRSCGSLEYAPWRQRLRHSGPAPAFITDLRADGFRRYRTLRSIRLHLTMRRPLAGRAVRRWSVPLGHARCALDQLVRSSGSLPKIEGIVKVADG